MTDKYDLSRYGLSYAGADPAQLARMNAAMFVNPLAADPPPEGWHPDRSQIDPMPAWRARTLSNAAHPPLEALDGNLHEDVVRRFHVEPLVAEQKRALDENRKRLAADRQKWWDDHGQ